MRDVQKVWQVMSETSASISTLDQGSARQQIEKHFSERRFYFPTLLASGLTSKSFSADLYSRRSPYANPTGQKKLLADMASAGYLEPDDAGGYTISEKGRQAINATNDAFYTRLNEANQFPADKLNELNSLLAKLVEACRESNLANGTLCLEMSYNGHPQVEAGSLAQTDQHIDDISTFRDDAHIAAWKPSGVSGHTWETLSYVWNGEANTVEKLIEQLPFRNYTAGDFAQTLTDLTQRRWIEAGDNGYQITAAGKKIREDAETATNNNHFGPWQVLTDDELARLSDLLTELKEINLKIAAENNTA